MNTTRHFQREEGKVKLIPFSFTIKLPPPRYERIITSRDEMGRIMHSMAPEEIR